MSTVYFHRPPASILHEKGYIFKFYDISQNVYGFSVKIFVQPQGGGTTGNEKIHGFSFGVHCKFMDFHMYYIHVFPWLDFLATLYVTSIRCFDVRLFINSPW